MVVPNLVIHTVKFVGKGGGVVICTMYSILITFMPPPDYNKLMATYY